MRVNKEAMVIEVSFNEIQRAEDGFRTIGQEIQEKYPDYNMEFFTYTSKDVICVLRPSEPA